MGWIGGWPEKKSRRDEGGGGESVFEESAEDVNPKTNTSDLFLHRNWPQNPSFTVSNSAKVKPDGLSTGSHASSTSS